MSERGKMGKRGNRKLFNIMLAVLVIGAWQQTLGQDADSGSVIYGRVTTTEGTGYEGRLRFGADEEAFWGSYFNGVKDANPWAVYVPREQLRARRPVEILGITVWNREGEVGLDRPFMTRFGDIARIDARGRDLQVTLRSGTTFDLDRFSADDFADGVRIWDASRGTVDIGEWHIRSIEFLPAPRFEAPVPLYGTVRTDSAEFTGYIEWDGEHWAASDLLRIDAIDGPRSLPFDAISAVARRANASPTVLLRDGSTIVLSDAGSVLLTRGIYVDDPRYGRVRITWDAFERVDFSSGGAGPAYSDFAPGQPIRGSVTTASGSRFVGRLVYDLDESETTETLDAPRENVDYNLPFGLVASIELHAPGAAGVELPLPRVTLAGGEQLELERSGDLGAANGGLLILPDDGQPPAFVQWTDVARIDFDLPR